MLFISSTFADCRNGVQAGGSCYYDSCASLSDSKCESYKGGLKKAIFCKDIRVCVYWCGPKCQKEKDRAQRNAELDAKQAQKKRAMQKAAAAAAAAEKLKPKRQKKDAYCTGYDECRCSRWGTTPCGTNDYFWGSSQCPNGKDYTKDNLCVTQSDRARCCTFGKGGSSSSSSSDTYVPRSKPQPSAMSRAVNAAKGMVGLDCIPQADANVRMRSYMEGNGCRYTGVWNPDPCAGLRHMVAKDGKTCKDHCYLIMAQAMKGKKLCAAVAEEVSAAITDPKVFVDWGVAGTIGLFLLGLLIVYYGCRSKLNENAYEQLTNEEL